MKQYGYLIIDSKNISIKINNFSLNISEFFNAKNLPEKYQKIFLKYYISNIRHKFYAEELLTKTSFNLNEYNNIIEGYDNNNLNLYLESNKEKEDIGKVKEFYNNLKNNNDYINYIRTLEVVFKINIKEKEKKLLKLK